MELLLGCGNDRSKRVVFDEISEGWTDLVTLDMDPSCKPDIVHDMDEIPLPFDDDMFHEIHAYEVLEHTGFQGDWRFFFNQFSDFWRILKPGGYLIGTVPMWHNVWAWADPGHRRVIAPETFVFLSQREYQSQVGVTKMTDYRDYYEADFDLIAKDESESTFGFVLQAVK